jgi:hypothetical protein
MFLQLIEGKIVEVAMAIKVGSETTKIIVTTWKKRNVSSMFVVMHRIAIAIE